MKAELKTFDCVKEILQDAIETMNVYLRLIENGGIPKSIVHQFITPQIDCGYSMGELIEVYCAHRLIDKVDTRKKYKDSKYNRNIHYGYAKIVFSKKKLREYIKLTESARREKNIDARFQIYNELDELVLGCIDKDTLDVKRGHKATRRLY